MSYQEPDDVNEEYPGPDCINICSQCQQLIWNENQVYHINNVVICEDCIAEREEECQTLRN